MSSNVLILGCNGFIGSHLVEKILQNQSWKITGLDISDHNLKPFLGNPQFTFHKGDLTQETAWVEEQIKKSDAVLPLVAIATPATYVQNPLRIFELDFEANLPIIRSCVKHQKRVVFPSTSEVYGMSPDKEFDEETSNLVLGPIHKERWIYSCTKQLLDRVIYAYSHQGLKFTLFRPFNWIGPRQDDIRNAKHGSSRVLTQFISNVLHGKEIQLVEGGTQRRCFTYIDDGIEALMKIIENKNNCADGKIFNIGNPKNNYSIAELADLVVTKMKNYPETTALAAATKIISSSSKEYYGNGYQDVSARVPAIERARNALQWEPSVDMESAITKTLDYYFSQ